MSIGPLEQFVFPGVYTKTLAEAPTATAAGSLRYPAIIGVGVEEESVTAFEMVRGSSSNADNMIVGENASSNGEGNTFDGVNVTIQVKHYPIVSGSGEGEYATDPSEVIVQINGESSLVDSVDAVTGIITMVNPPLADDLVVLNYYFKRRDTYVDLEDVSDQANGSTTKFTVYSASIVSGDNGGTNATADDIDSTAQTEVNGTLITVPVIKVLVDGVEAEITALDGGTSSVTLATAPADGAVVQISYFTNDYQDTFDILPAETATSIEQVGYDAGRTDFISGRDYVLANENEIHWGNAVTVEAQDSILGSEEFGSDQVTAKMIDWLYEEINMGAGDGSSVVFTMPFDPVRGDGTGKTLTDVNDGSFIVTVDGIAVTVLSIDGRSVTLESAPALSSVVNVTAYANDYISDSWALTITDKTAETYQVVGNTTGYTAYSVTSPVVSGLATSIAFLPPSRIYGEEVITVTVAIDGTFTVTSVGGLTTGGGLLGQTYIDTVTGFTFTLTGDNPASETDVVYTVSADFVAGGSEYEYGIPNVRFNVSTIAALADGSIANINTYSMLTADEPDVGDVYYVSFQKEKTDFTTKYLTSFPDVQRLFGSLQQTNPIVIAADLAFQNGAQALALKQVVRAAGSSEASVLSYRTAIDEFDDPLDNDTRPCVVQVVTSNQQVISYLKTANQKQSSIRYQNERTSYFGFALGTSPEAASAYAKAMKSELMTGVYPDGAVITIPDSNGNDQDIQVGGEYIACALAGADTSPTYDVATPLTNTTITGILRFTRKVNKSKAEQIAQSGLTVLESVSGVIKVLMALTTDMTSALTRDPRVIDIKHFVQRGVRTTCAPYVGQKNIGDLTGDVEKSLNSYFAALRRSKLIVSFQGIKATVDTSDTTIVNVVVYYVPVVGVNWITVTHYLRSTQ